MADSRDAIYRETLLEPLRKCSDYKPRMGVGRPTELPAFQQMYGSDPLYAWMGLDSPLMYAAHKAAGGMTSIYRQLGIGCERLWRHVLIDSAGLTDEQANWKYETPAASGKSKTLSLDGRLALSDIAQRPVRERVADWLHRATQALDIQTDIRGVVFEVRQGYKSKDSKRQNADIDNASHALKHAYVPAVTVLSTQMDSDIQLRYRQNNWVVLLGEVGTSDDLSSCFAFTSSVLNYDLAGFFERNSAQLKSEVQKILIELLEPS